MNGFARLLSGIALCLAVAPAARAAEAEKPKPPRPVSGVLVKVAAEAVTVRPTPPVPARKAALAEPPDDVTFAVAEGKTEVIYARVMSERTTDTGHVARMLGGAERGALADLTAGMPVEVTAADGAATRVTILWPTIRGTIVRIVKDSVTVRPAGAEDAAGDVTVSVAPDTTRVTFRLLVNSRRTAAGQLVRSYRFEDGSLDALKEGQSVGVCAKRGAAAQIEIEPPPPDEPAK